MGRSTKNKGDRSSRTKKTKKRKKGARKRDKKGAKRKVWTKKINIIASFGLLDGKLPFILLLLFLLFVLDITFST